MIPVSHFSNPFRDDLLTDPEQVIPQEIVDCEPCSQFVENYLAKSDLEQLRFKLMSQQEINCRKIELVKASHFLATHYCPNCSLSELLSQISEVNAPREGVLLDDLKQAHASLPKISELCKYHFEKMFLPQALNHQGIASARAVELPQKSGFKRKIEQSKISERSIKTTFRVPQSLVPGKAVVRKDLKVENEIWYDDLKEFGSVINSCRFLQAESVTTRLGKVLSKTKATFWCSLKKEKSDALVSVKITITKGAYFSEGLKITSFDKAQRPKEHYAIHVFEHIDKKDYKGPKSFSMAIEQKPILSIRLCDFHGELVKIHKGKKIAGHEIIEIYKLFIPVFSAIPIYIFDSSEIDGIFLSALLGLSKGKTLYETWLNCVVSNSQTLKAINQSVVTKQDRQAYYPARNSLLQTKIGDLFKFCEGLPSKAPELVNQLKIEMDQFVTNINKLPEEEVICSILQAAKIRFDFRHPEYLLSRSEATLQDVMKTVVDLAKIDEKIVIGLDQQQMVITAKQIRQKIYDLMFLPLDPEEIEKLRCVESQQFWTNLNTVANARVFVVLPENCSEELAALL